MFNRYGGWHVFKGKNCVDAVKIIEVGLKEKNSLYIIGSYAIQMITGNFKGSYKDFEDKVYEQKPTISFDEAAKIADKIKARKGKK